MVKKKKPEFVITNMVASASLGLELDLFQLAHKIKEIEYEPEQFPGAILKFQEPKASLLLFKNGKIVCVGCKKRSLVEKTIEKNREAYIRESFYKDLFVHDMNNILQNILFPLEIFELELKSLGDTSVKEMLIQV